MPQAEDTGLTKKTATATRNLGGRSMAVMKDGATWALILKILLVSLLRRFQPKAVTSFELLCLAVPLPDAMARWMVSPHALTLSPLMLQLAEPQVCPASYIQNSPCSPW